jgi:cell division protein FtsQ
MKRVSILNKQSVRRNRRKDLLVLKKGLGQLGFGLVKILLFVLGLGVLSVAFISGYQFLSSSSCLALKNIVVTGVSNDLQKDLMAVSGITEGETFVSMDLARIEKNIEKHPWIKSVALKKEFPDTLYIQAEQEEAAAIVLADKMYLMDRQGAIFKDVQDDDNIDLPVVTGLSGGDLGNMEYLQRVSTLINYMQRLNAPLLSTKELSEINVGTDGDLSIYFNRLSLKVFMGKQDFGRKIDSLGEIVKHLEGTHRLYQARSIDLDYGDRGVVAFRDKAA